MAKSTTITKVKTPKGELQWVNITGEGKENLSGRKQYVASIAFDPEEPKWKKLMEDVEAFWAENRPKKIKTPKSNGFYPEMVATDETDEDGDPIKKETGRMLLAFKTSTTWPDGKPTIVKTYNSKAKEVQLGETKIGNGSMGSIAGSYDIYVNTAPGSGAVVDAGVTFYLSAIQISKLVEFTEDAGFEADEDEDGWTGDEGWEGEGADEESEAPAKKAGPRL